MHRFRACRYHTIHHTGKAANFCLFMPLFDRLGGTLDAESWDMQEKNRAGNLITPAIASHECRNPLGLDSYFPNFGVSAMPPRVS
jgi:sterol desaturase/sphingolipid hydroxylase (fatty acid hydroxylase superfamily)